MATGRVEVTLKKTYEVEYDECLTDDDLLDNLYNDDTFWSDTVMNDSKCVVLSSQLDKTEEEEEEEEAPED